MKVMDGIPCRLRIALGHVQADSHNEAQSNDRAAPCFEARPWPRGRLQPASWRCDNGRNYRPHAKLPQSMPMRSQAGAGLPHRPGTTIADAVLRRNLSA
jgi:hypothetical protein